MDILLNNTKFLNKYAQGMEKCIRFMNKSIQNQSLKSYQAFFLNELY